MGTPSGTKSRRKCQPCLTMPTIVTPMNTIAASAKVTMMWLVTVKLYGISPSRLLNRMNRNSVKTNGKKSRAPWPAFVSTISATNSYIISATDCHRPGTRAARRVPSSINAVISTTAIVMNSAEFV